MTPADLVKQYIALRNKLDSITMEHEAVTKPYVDGMANIENAVQKYLNDNNLDNIKTEHGTAYKKMATSVKMADRNAFIQFITQLPDGMKFVTNAVAKEEVVAYIEKNGVPPPGLDVTYFQKTQFNKPR